MPVPNAMDRRAVDPLARTMAVTALYAGVIVAAVAYRRHLHGKAVTAALSGVMANFAADKGEELRRMVEGASPVVGDIVDRRHEAVRVEAADPKHKTAKLTLEHHVGTGGPLAFHLTHQQARVLEADLAEFLTTSDMARRINEMVKALARRQSA